MTNHDLSSSGNPPLPSSVDELLTLEDEPFVWAAYQRVLGREPDPAGLSGYLAQVRSGVDKAQIVAVMAASDEGRQHRAALTGLAPLVQRHLPRPRAGLVRAWQGLLRALIAPSREAGERKLRAMDNRLYRLERALHAQSELAQRTREDIAQMKIMVEALPQSASWDQATPSSGTPLPPARIRVGHHVPPRVDQLLREMQRLRIDHKTSKPGSAQ